MDWLSAGAESLISFQARSRFQGKGGTGHTPLKSSSLSGECPLYPGTGRSGGSIYFLLRGCL